MMFIFLHVFHLKFTINANFIYIPVEVTIARIFKYSDTQYTSLTPDKILNSLVYRVLFYVNIYGNFKLSKKTVRIFWPTLYIIYYQNYSALDCVTQCSQSAAHLY